MEDFDLDVSTQKSVLELLEEIPKIRAENAAAMENRHFVRFDEDDMVIVLFPNGIDHAHYDISLHTIRSSADVMTWLRQLRGKKWFSPQVEHDFLTAFFSAHTRYIDEDYRSGDNWVWRSR